MVEQVRAQTYYDHDARIASANVAVVATVATVAVLRVGRIERLTCAYAYAKMGCIRAYREMGYAHTQGWDTLITLHI